MDSKVLKKMIDDVLKKHQVTFYDSEFVKEGDDYFLRIFIDKEGSSMDLDTCVAVSEDISLILDKNDPVSHDYILEVTSAGAERPLKDASDFIAAKGKYIWVVLKNPVESFDELIGTLLDANQATFTLEFKVKTRSKTVTIAYDEVEQAITTVKF